MEKYQSPVLKLLHDMNSRWSSLPGSYMLPEVVIGRRFAEGGEAVIREGSYNGRAVAIRQFLGPGYGGWKSLEGETILRVSE